MSSKDQSISERLTDLVSRQFASQPVGEQEATLQALVERYEAISDPDSQEARQVRHAFLLTLQSQSNVILNEELVSAFLTDHEDATEAEMPAEPRQFLSYPDGVYWSVITAASIGYGDITPVTRVGKIIAATLGTMGVITISILAGLILYQLTPKQTPG